jgi:hypothetical protein
MSIKQGHYAVSNFHIEVDGASGGYLSSFQAPSYEIEDVSQALGPDYVTKKMMGAPKIGEATAVFNISQAGALLAWVETVWNKQCVEKDTTVRLADQDYNIKRGIDMGMCVITGIEFPELKASDGKKHFEITAKWQPQNLKYVAGGGKAQGVMGTKAKAHMVNNYEVHPVFGLKTEWITSIGLPKVTPKISKESHGKFRLALGGGGGERFTTNSPGHKYIDTLTLRGPLTSGRKALCEWITEVVQGKPWKQNLTVTELLSVDGGTRSSGAAQRKEFSPAEEQLKGNPRH